MGSKSPTTNTSQTTSADPTAATDVTAALNRARQASKTPYQAYTGQLTAGVNSQETGAINATNDLSSATNGYLGQAAGLAGASTAAVNPTAVNGSTIAQYESPYQSDVVNATMAEIANQNKQQSEAQTSSAISAGAFGGDRAGVAQAALAGQQDLASNATLANLNNQNYSQALGEANTQQATTLSADQANRAALQSGSQIYSNLGDLASSTGIANANAQLQGGLLEQQTQQASDTAQYGQFENQQAYPFQTAEFLGGLTSSLAPELGTSSTGQTVSSPPNVLNSILGAGLGVGSFFLPKADGGACLADVPQFARGGGVKGDGTGFTLGDAHLFGPRRAHGGRTLGDLGSLGDLEYAGLGGVRRYADGGMAGMPYSDASGYVPTVSLSPGRAPSPGLSMSQPSQQPTTDPSMANLTTGLGMAGKNFMNSNAGDSVSDFAQDNLGLATGGKVVDLGSARRVKRGYDDGGVVPDTNSLLFDPNALGAPASLGSIQPGLGAAALPSTMSPAAQGLGAANLPSSQSQGLGAAANLPSAGPTGSLGNPPPVPVAPAGTLTPSAPNLASPASQGLGGVDQSGAGSGGLGAIDRAAPSSPTSMESYYGRVRALESNGGDNSATSPSGAAGAYQIMPSTWTGLMRTHPELGLTSDGIRDPQQQEAAVRALTADNAAALKSALGRDPSPSELYLAHQQGAQGAISMLTQPGARAGDLVGDKAIAMNGGDPNMKAGDFASMWMGRFNGATPSSASAYAGGGNDGAGLAAGSSQAGTLGAAASLPQTGLAAVRNAGSGLLGAIMPSGMHFTDNQRLAVLTAGLGMMASPSRSFGQALGQGGLQGVQTYESQQNIALRSQELQASMLRIAQEGKNYESEAAYRKAEGSARQQDAAANTNRVNLERYQLIPGPDGDFRFLDKLNPTAGLMTSAQIGGGSGAPVGTPQNGGSGTMPPSSGAGAPSAPSAPSAPVAPTAGGRPAARASGPLALDSSNFTRTGNPTLRVPQGYLPTNYYQNQLRAQNDPVARDTMAKQTVEDTTDADARARKAYGAIYYSDEMDRAAAGLPQTGPLAPGGFFNERLAIAKNFNAVMSSISGLSDLQVNPDAIAKGETLLKDKARLTGDLTSTLGSREAASVYASQMSAVPGADNTRAGYKAVSSAIRTLSQREIDRNAFYQDYVARYGNSNGAEVAFNQMNPAMVYAKQAASLARVPQQASDLLRANSNDPRVIAAFESKYGAGTARYFTGQVAQ